MSATPDPTEEIQITNSTLSPIVILIPSTGTPDANGTLVYGEDRDLLTAVDGSTSIPASATKTFVLDQTFVDSSTGHSEYNNLYDLLPSTANWLAPVANMTVMQAGLPRSYPATTVTAASAPAFQNAGAFLQTISAYPTSALAKSYQQAVSQAVSAAGNASGAANDAPGSAEATAQNIPATVNAFFEGTKDYQNLTQDKVVVVQSYYDTFPFVWAEYANGPTTYYLYSSNGHATSFVGTISLTPPAVLNVAVANAGYTCTFTPAANGSDTSTVAVTASAAKSLTYTGGLFVNDVDADVPEIALRGTFQVKSTFTGKAADTQIITVLTGSVNSATCIGFDSPQLSTDPDSTFWDTLFHPKNAAQIFQSIMQIGGFLMLLVFAGQTIYSVVQWARGLAAKNKPMTLEEFQTKMQESLKAQQDQFADALKKVSADRVEAPADADAAQSAIAEQTDIVGDNVISIKLEVSLNIQVENVEGLAQYASGMDTANLTALESAASKIEASQQALDEAPTDRLGPVVDAQAPVVEALNGNIATLQTAVSSEIDASVDASITANAQVVDTAVQEVNDTLDGQESIGTDDAPKADPIEIPDVIV
jgi:hypothetical protein